jgi:rhamnosyl/mannosyltransferase
VIHFPIDSTPYIDAKDEWDEELPSEWQSESLVLFVGRLVYYKGLDVLLDALRLTPRARLACVGVGPLLPRLVEQAARLGITERVRFLGAVPGGRLRSLYKSARFLVLPSVAPSEAFGMVQLESMAAGRPVISTDLKSGVPYVNQHGVTGLIVPPNSATALAAAMQTLLDDQALASALGSAAQKRVLAEFDVDRVVAEHVDLYASVLDAARRSV